MVGLDIVGSLHALGRFEQFQTQGENYTLIAPQPGSNEFKPKHQTVCLCHALALCRRWLWPFCHRVFYTLITILDCEGHFLPPFFGLSYVAVQKAAPNQQKQTK
jgi:hypothetical protein